MRSLLFSTSDHIGHSPRLTTQNRRDSTRKGTKSADSKETKLESSCRSWTEENRGVSRSPWPPSRTQNRSRLGRRQSPNSGMSSTLDDRFGRMAAKARTLTTGTDTAVCFLGSCETSCVAMTRVLWWSHHHRMILFPASARQPGGSPVEEEVGRGVPREGESSVDFSDFLADNQNSCNLFAEANDGRSKSTPIRFIVLNFAVYASRSEHLRDGLVERQSTNIESNRKIGLLVSSLY